MSFCLKSADPSFCLKIPIVFLSEIGEYAKRGCVVIKAYGAASLFSGLRFGYLSCD